MRLTQFGTYTLPLYNRRDQISTGDAGGSLTALVSGVSYDHYGTDQAPESTMTVSASWEIIETTAAAVQTERDAIRALLGKRQRLWARTPSGSWRFVWARLARVRMERRIEYIYYQPVEATFEVAQPGWNGDGHGAPWYLDAGEDLDEGLFIDNLDQWLPSSSPLTMTVNNGGNRTVSDVILTVTAGSDSISNIRVVCTAQGVDWTYSGTVAAGDVLTVDGGARSVLNDGSNAYSGFALNAGHAVADWLRLAPGNNTVVVTFSGNTSDTAIFNMTYYDGWQ